MTDREGLADLARRAYWRAPGASSAAGWLSVADAVLHWRRQQTQTAVEVMEARIEAAEARAAAAATQLARMVGALEAKVARLRARDAD